MNKSFYLKTLMAWQIFSSCFVWASVQPTRGYAYLRWIKIRQELSFNFSDNVAQVIFNEMRDVPLEGSPGMSMHKSGTDWRCSVLGGANAWRCFTGMNTEGDTLLNADNGNPRETARVEVMPTANGVIIKFGDLLTTHPSYATRLMFNAMTSVRETTEGSYRAKNGQVVECRISDSQPAISFCTMGMDRRGLGIPAR